MVNNFHQEYVRLMGMLHLRSCWVVLCKNIKESVNYKLFLSFFLFRKTKMANLWNSSNPWRSARPRPGCNPLYSLYQLCHNLEMLIYRQRKRKRLLILYKNQLVITVLTFRFRKRASSLTMYHLYRIVTCY